MIRRSVDFALRNRLFVMAITLLLVTNTPDNRLEVFSIAGSAGQNFASFFEYSAFSTGLPAAR